MTQISLPMRLFLMSLLLPLLVSVPVAAAPAIPSSDSVVLERLPFKPNDPVARELAQMRAELRRNPENLQVAVALARRYYSMVSEEGDPRYLGYAQAALAPWWEMPAPPVEVQVLRASVRQFRHDFAGAVNDLSQVIARDPGHRQALILRAIIHIVQARYVPAKEDCRRLVTAGDLLIGGGCEAMVNGLTGKASQGYEALVAAMAATRDAAPSQTLWIQIRLAELAQRLGRVADAERHFRHALALDIDDTFLLAAYADLLLEQKRPKEVVALLEKKSRSDVLLLRLMFAERALTLPSAKDRETALAARYAAARMRGETVHQQEEARFALYVEGDPRKALELARENWKVQREPRDAQVFLEAAVAAKDRIAAEPVLQWLDDSGIEDAHLISLGQQLTARGK